MSQVVLHALKKEHKRYAGIAARAKKKCDDYCSAGSDLFKIYEDFKEVRKIEDIDERIKAMGSLIAREKKVHAIMKLDLLKLTDKQVEAESQARSLETEIFRHEIRTRH